VPVVRVVPVGVEVAGGTKTLQVARTPVVKRMISRCQGRALVL
jgi:hypothetical protein